MVLNFRGPARTAPSVAGDSAAGSGGSAAGHAEGVAAVAAASSFADLRSVDLSSDLAMSPQKRQRLPEAADIEYHLTQFCPDGSVYSAAWERLAVMQYRCEHAARPSMFFKFRSSFEQWLVASEILGSLPPDMNTFQKEHRCACVITKPVPSEEGPSPTVAWSMAWYIAGGVSQILHIVECMDSFTAWRQREMSARPSSTLRARIKNCTAMSLVLDASDMEVETLVEDLRCPVRLLVEVAPPTLKQRYPHAFVEFMSDHVVTIMFKGDTYNFKDRFDEHGIPGRYAQTDGQAIEEENEEAKKSATYVRVLRAVDVSTPIVKKNVLKMFHTALFVCTPVLVTFVDCAEAARASPCDMFMGELKALSNVYPMNSGAVEAL